MAETEKKEIIIIGGGIIGCTSAYFLTRHPYYDPARHKITLIEATEIAGGASGKAGGLLALWAYPNSIVPLSYALHAELAKEYDGEQRWGYRIVNCGQLGAQGRRLDRLQKTLDAKQQSVSLQKRDKKALSKLKAAGLPKDLDWIAADSALYYLEMGAPNTTAQVHPYKFTTSMAGLAQEKGATIILGTVTSINQSYGAIRSVTYTDKATSVSQTIPATDVIICAGPWTRGIYPRAPISSLRAHSVVIRPSRPVSPYAIFTEIKLPSNFRALPGGSSSPPSSSSSSSPVWMASAEREVSPEIYARPNNEVYVCGEGDTMAPLPLTTDAVTIDDQRCQDIVDYVSSISDELRDGEITAKHACYLPTVTTGRGGPLIGPTGIEGLLMAAGHTCWGIQNAPATGKLISEFVFDGMAKSAQIEMLDPRTVL